MNLNRPSFEDSFGGSYLSLNQVSSILVTRLVQVIAMKHQFNLRSITDPFFLGVRPVTQAHWSSVMGIIHPNSKKDGVRVFVQLNRYLTAEVEAFLEKLNQGEREFMGFEGTLAFAFRS